jgi:RNA polymerase sigma factor (sigma-70 family)
MFEENATWAQRIADGMRWKFGDWVNANELRQAALIGLWLAIRRYDPADGRASLRTFARRRVRGSVLEYWRELVLTTHRRSGRREVVEFDEENHGAQRADTEARICAAQQILAAWSWVASRPGVQGRQEAWIWREVYIHGRTHADVAHEIGFPRSWVTEICKEIRAELLTGRENAA